ncbi:MAG TPA: hypothetical protein VK021_07915 [Flavobacteriaceae bacterium]|nr:hypothetical protein [Flavobacteriaceae bacterium]
MRRLLFIIIPCLILFGCKNESSNDSSTASDSIKPQKEEKETYLFSKDTNTNLERWTEYYESIDADFELKKFEIISTSALEKMKGTIPGNFDEDFDPIYESLLIYSPSGEKYIDLDSYHWEIGEENQLNFSPDQEINLVNIPNKTVERIAFRGPSNTVEEAYWKGNDTVVLLEESYDRVPYVSLIDLKNEKIETYIYPDTLESQSIYNKERIQRGIKRKYGDKNNSLQI